MSCLELNTEFCLEKCELKLINPTIYRAVLPCIMVKLSYYFIWRQKCTILVWGSLALAPEEQTLLGGHLLNGNILDSESKHNKQLEAKYWDQVHFPV